MSHPFQEDLLSCEEILWEGKPETSAIFTSSDVYLVPFSLVWGLFSFFWEFTALSALEAGSVMFPLFGIPFVLMGVYFIIGRFFYKAWKKKRTYYAVTNKRVLSLVKTGARNLQAAYINTLPSVNTSRGSNGIGTVTFGNPPAYPMNMYENTGMELFNGTASNGSVSFFDIREAEIVSNLVSQLRDST